MRFMDGEERADDAQKSSASFGTGFQWSKKTLKNNENGQQ